MKKKIVVAVLASAMVVATLAGCGSTTDSSSDTAASAAQETTSTTEESSSTTEENTSTTEETTSDAEESKVVKPMGEELDMAGLADGTYAVEFASDSIVEEDSGLVMKDVSIFTQDNYDMVDINSLAVGDTIVVAGEDVVVESIENNDSGDILINGGIYNNGVTLTTEEDTNGYVVKDTDDETSYTNAGTADLQISKDVTYTDNSDMDNPGTATYDNLQDTIADSSIDYNEYNTTITVEGGAVVSIDRVYMP